MFYFFFNVWQVYICVYLAFFDQMDEVLAFSPEAFSVISNLLPEHVLELV